MILAIETICLCLLFWLLCYLGTGTDLKNVKGIDSYPDEVIEYVERNSKLREYIHPTNMLMKLGSNVVVFTVIIFILCFFVKKEDYLSNFVAALIMGESLNLFDLLVIDLLWWRHDKRVRFEGTKDKKEMYKNPRKHVMSFLRAIPLFLVVALIVAGLLMIF